MKTHLVCLMLALLLCLAILPAAALAEEPAPELEAVIPLARSDAGDEVPEETGDPRISIDREPMLIAPELPEPIAVDPEPGWPYMPVDPDPQFEIETGLRGDVNFDDTVDAYDTALLLQQLAEQPVAVYYMYENAADVNNDGRIDLRDAAVLAAHDPEDLGTWEIRVPIYVCYKPVIYLYPTETTDVTVTLGREDAITVDYPAYDGGWRVTAAPDGALTGADGRQYYSLYYEADVPQPEPDGGFVVARDELVPFLEQSLAALGLTDREAEEMIVYWLPQMRAFPYVYVGFSTGEAVDAAMPLSVEPAPDSVLRVWMLWRGLREPIEVEPQELPAFERKGFAVVEWGGMILPE